MACQKIEISDEFMQTEPKLWGKDIIERAGSAMMGPWYLSMTTKPNHGYALSHPKVITWEICQRQLEKTQHIQLLLR